MIRTRRAFAFGTLLALVAALLTLPTNTLAQGPAKEPIKIETFSSPFSGGPGLVYAEYEPENGPNFTCVFASAGGPASCFLSK